jgi:hypothetical protein
MHPHRNYPVSRWAGAPCTNPTPDHRPLCRALPGRLAAAGRRPASLGLPPRTLLGRLLAVAYVWLGGTLGRQDADRVLVLGQLFGGVGTDPPSWAVAGATLAVVALFQPAGRRIQQVVDRRKYNAARTIEQFSARLRNEVDLDDLSAELLAVVDQTIQPTRASLWLRPSSPNSRRTAR